MPAQVVHGRQLDRRRAHVALGRVERLRLRPQLVALVAHLGRLVLQPPNRRAVIDNVRVLPLEVAHNVVLGGAQRRALVLREDLDDHQRRQQRCRVAGGGVGLVHALEHVLNKMQNYRNYRDRDEEKFRDPIEG